MPDKTERSLLKKAQMSTPRGFAGYEDHTGNNSMPRIITFGSMPSYREDKMIEMKQQQKQQIPPIPQPLVMPSVSQSSAPSSVQHMYAKENRKDSATSPVDPALMDQDDELLLLDDRPSRFIELSPNNLPKLSIKDKLLAASVAGNHQPRWASILSQTMPMDLTGAPTTVTNTASNSVTTPLLQPDENPIHHSRYSLHRQSSQGTNSAGSDSPLTEVERTLKSLNGYHEDILEALQNVSQQRQQHQKSLECIRPGNSSGGPGSGEGSGPASLGRQTPNELKNAFLDTDYGGKFPLLLLLMETPAWPSPFLPKAAFCETVFQKTNLSLSLSHPRLACI